eukprot:COSAG04_NODE_904_length_9520_cov_6.614584_1_plen_81_part_10
MAASRWAFLRTQALVTKGREEALRYNPVLVDVREGLPPFNVIGATFCLLRINPDNRELFATAPAAARGGASGGAAAPRAAG